MVETIACILIAKSLVFSKIEYYSRELGAYENMVDFIIRNESTYNNCAVGDHHVKEPSYGLVQINTHFNPDVKPEQAFDPDFAIQYLIEDLKEGKCQKWTTCRLFKKKYPNHPYFQLHTET